MSAAVGGVFGGGLAVRCGFGLGLGDWLAVYVGLGFEDRLGFDDRLGFGRRTPARLAPRVRRPRAPVARAAAPAGTRTTGTDAGAPAAPLGRPPGPAPDPRAPRVWARQPSRAPSLPPPRRPSRAPSLPPPRRPARPPPSARPLLPLRRPPPLATGTAVRMTFVPQPDGSIRTVPRARSPSQATAVSGSSLVIRISPNWSRWRASEAASLHSAHNSGGDLTSVRLATCSVMAGGFARAVATPACRRVATQDLQNTTFQSPRRRRDHISMVTMLIWSRAAAGVRNVVLCR